MAYSVQSPRGPFLGFLLRPKTPELQVVCEEGVTFRRDSSMGQLPPKWNRDYSGSIYFLGPCPCATLPVYL